jgi:hypothetical protein
MTTPHPVSGDQRNLCVADGKPIGKYGDQTQVRVLDPAQVEVRDAGT